MAIYHLSVKTISRSQGRSATAAAAYRSGTEIADGRTGEVHDYTRKAGVVHSEIILPEGADERFQDRSVLWNEAEKSENRKNSRVAREYEVALPSELNDKEREKLATEFGGWLSERFGVGVDVCIHEPHREGDDRNHHAHILTTTREINSDKFGKKTREIDQKNSGAVEEVRGKWGEMVNDALEKNKSLERVDHRSNERRGLEAAPTKHEGPARTAMKRRGIDTDRVAENREIRHANGLLQELRQRVGRFKKMVRDALKSKIPGREADNSVSQDRAFAADEPDKEAEKSRKKKGKSLLETLRSGQVEAMTAPPQQESIVPRKKDTAKEQDHQALGQVSMRDQLKNRGTFSHETAKRAGEAAEKNRQSQTPPEKPKSLAARLNDRLVKDREGRLGKELAGAITGLEKMERMEKAGKAVDPDLRQKHQQTLFNAAKNDKSGQLDKAMKPQEKAVVLNAVKAVQPVQRNLGVGRERGRSR